MTSGQSDIVDIACELRIERPKAVLIYDGKTEAWLPLSQIEIDRHGPGNSATIAMPEWLAHDKGLI